MLQGRARRLLRLLNILLFQGILRGIALRGIALRGFEGGLGLLHLGAGIGDIGNLHVRQIYLGLRCGEGGLRRGHIRLRLRH